MAKKDFISLKGAIRAIARASDDTTPKSAKKKKVEGNPEEIYEKITLEISKTNIGKIRSMSFWDKKTIKLIINESLEKTIKTYERKHGELKVP